MYVVLLHGPAASGKHTIGSRVAEALGVPLFHNHLTVDLAKTLFDFGAEPFVRLRARVWRAAFEEAAAAGRSFVFTFHPEATVDARLPEELAGIVEAVGGRVHWVELRCSEQGVLARLGEPSRALFGKLTDADLYREIESAGGFEFPPLPSPLLVIDTEELAPEAAAARIVAAVEEVEG